MLIKDVEFFAARKSRTEAAAGKYSGFSICMENRDGQRVRRESVLLTNVVRYAGEQPCEAPVQIETLKLPSALKTSPGPVDPKPAAPFFERLKKRVQGWFGK